MAIRYIGTDIIRDYKGFEITKKYFIRGEYYYTITGQPGIHYTLKAAKQYIDKLGTK